jgi:hypothetical protein
MNKDEMYVINQPIHTIFSIVVIDTDFPIPKRCHDYIDDLQQISDTCYIFSDACYKSRKINKKKFTTLYNGNCFIDVSGDNILPIVNKALEYSVELFSKKHFTYLLMKLSDLDKYSRENFNRLLSNIQKVNMSNVMQPVLEIHRLNNENMYEYYREDHVPVNIDPIQCTFINRLFPDFANFIMRMNYTLKKANDEDIKNIYSSWETGSKVQFYRKDTIKEILKFTENNPSFIGTFSGDRVDVAYASLLKRLSIKNHNTNIEDLDLGKEV